MVSLLPNFGRKKDYWHKMAGIEEGQIEVDLQERQEEERTQAQDDEEFADVIDPMEWDGFELTTQSVEDAPEGIQSILARKANKDSEASKTRSKTKFLRACLKNKRVVKKAKFEKIEKGFYNRITLTRNSVLFDNRIIYTRGSQGIRQNNEEEAALKEFKLILRRAANSLPVTIDGQIEEISLDSSGVIFTDENTTLLHEWS